MFNIGRPTSRHHIVYFITCHNSIEHVVFLIALLYSPDDIFIIHVDKKTPPRFHSQISSVAGMLTNVFVLESSAYSWAGYSQVSTTLRAISFALELPLSWSHFIVLSEQHLPLRHRDAIKKELQHHHSVFACQEVGGMNDVAKADIRSRFGAIYNELPGVGAFADEPVGDDQLNLGGLYHGSNWLCISHGHCRFLCSQPGQTCLSRFHRVVHADEMAIQTVLQTHFSDIDNKDLTAVAYPHLTDNNSLFFNEELFLSSMKGPQLFIRKRPNLLTPAVAKLLPFDRPGSAILQQLQKRVARSNDLDKPIHRSNRFFEAFRNSLATIHRNTLTVIQQETYDNAVNYIILSNHLPPGYSVRLVSSNSVEYRALTVSDKPFADRFEMPMVEDGFFKSRLRLRFGDLFLKESVLPLGVANRGLVSSAGNDAAFRTGEAVSQLLSYKY